MALDSDTGDSLLAAAWLANSLSAPESLRTPQDLSTFLAGHAYTGRLDGDQSEVENVRAIRETLRQLLLTERDEAHALINPILRRFESVPQLSKHGERDWHVHAVDEQSPLASRMLVETAMAMATVVISAETSRIAICQAEGCENVVVDLTKNRSRRFCTSTCANRMAVAAYRARQRQ